MFNCSTNCLCPISIATNGSTSLLNENFQFSSQLVCYHYIRSSCHNCCHLLLVIPLVYQQSLVIVVNFSFFSSLVTFSCIQLYLFPVNMTRLDQLSYPRACYNCTFTSKHNKKCMYVYLKTSLYRSLQLAVGANG